MWGLGDGLDVAAEGDFGEAEEVAVGGGGDVGGFGDFVGEGEEDFADRVGAFAEAEVDVGDAGLGTEAGGDVAEDRGLTSAFTKYGITQR